MRNQYIRNLILVPLKKLETFESTKGTISAKHSRNLIIFVTIVKIS